MPCYKKKIVPPFIFRRSIGKVTSWNLGSNLNIRILYEAKPKCTFTLPICFVGGNGWLYKPNRNGQGVEPFANGLFTKISSVSPLEKGPTDSKSWIRFRRILVFKSGKFGDLSCGGLLAPLNNVCHSGITNGTTFLLVIMCGCMSLPFLGLCMPWFVLFMGFLSIGQLSILRSLCL